MLWLGRRSGTRVCDVRRLRRQRDARARNLDTPENLNTDRERLRHDPAGGPDFTLAGLDSGTQALTDFRGKWVLVNFWASWCPPCRDETPDLQSFFEHNANRDFVILGVNQQEREGAVRSFVENYGVSYPVLLDSSGEVSEAYGVGRGMPITFLVSPDGVITEVVFSRFTEDQFTDLEARLQ